MASETYSNGKPRPGRWGPMARGGAKAQGTLGKGRPPAQWGGMARAVKTKGGKGK